MTKDEFATLAREEAEKWLRQRFPSYRLDDSTLHIDVEIFLVAALWGRAQGVEEAIDEVKGWRGKRLRRRNEHNYGRAK